MAFSTGNSSGPAAEINVTPLIDVLLVLLIIFMVIVPLTPRGLSTLVPQLSSAQPQSAPESPLVVDVSGTPGGGVVYALNRKPMEKAALGADLNRLLRVRQSKVMFVRGDPTLEFAPIAEVIGLGKQANADRVGILTPADTSRP